MKELVPRLDLDDGHDKSRDRRVFDESQELDG